MRALAAQLRLELAVLARNGESLLLTLGIPVLLLAFFANVDVLPIDGEPIDFLAPGVLALAVLSTSLVNLAIATGFEREYGVLKRLGSTPLGRPRLLAAKVLSILVVEAVQILVLWLLALAFGWEPAVDAGFVLAVVLGTVACGGLGLVMAGTLKALVVLAAANGAYLVLLLLSGMVIPLEELPGAVQAVSRALPSTALADAVRGSVTEGLAVPGRAWAVLAAWAVAAPVAAARWFRWE
ncbi:MAG TPA: ABC transporter permease [Acidimicrobiales bacterium]|nr:ABC transporter permease [Acidimicrobiales bacterium]